jgi:NADH dehydrogenase
MTRLQVVVVGCGFGGIEAVRKLAHADVEITLIDRTNHHLFQPLLYQVATAGLTAPSVSGPIRHILRRQVRSKQLTVLQAEVVDIDVGGRCVVLERGERIAYDHLIVAAGATHSYFGHDDWAQHAQGLKTLADAFNIRARVIGAFENAERCIDDAQREPWLTFVVIGGGPTGVEMAGTFAELANKTLRGEYRRFDPGSARVVLLEGGERVLPALAPVLSQRAREQLEGLGVDVHTNSRVTDVDAHGVTYATSAAGTSDAPAPAGRINARTLVWAAGVAASPLGRTLERNAGARLDRAGRVVVEADLGLARHADIWVVGDLAAAQSHEPGGPKPVPGVSPAAKQMGRTAASNLLRRLDGRATQPFRYIDYGVLATIGRSAAVADVHVPLLGHLRFSGFPAWIFWLVVHIYFLIGFRNRLFVLLEWASAYVTFDRHARVVATPATLDREN